MPQPASFTIVSMASGAFRTEQHYGTRIFEGIRNLVNVCNEFSTRFPASNSLLMHFIEDIANNLPTSEDSLKDSRDTILQCLQESNDRETQLSNEDNGPSASHSPCTLPEASRDLICADPVPAPRTNSTAKYLPPMFSINLSGVACGTSSTRLADTTQGIHRTYSRIGVGHNDIWTRSHQHSAPLQPAQIRVFERRVNEFRAELQLLNHKNRIQATAALQDQFQRRVHETALMCIKEQTPNGAPALAAVTNEYDGHIDTALELPVNMFSVNPKAFPSYLKLPPTAPGGLRRQNAFTDRRNPRVFWLRSFDSNLDPSDPCPTPTQFQDFEQAMSKFIGHLDRSPGRVDSIISCLRANFQTRLYRVATSLLYRETKNLREIRAGPDQPVAAPQAPVPSHGVPAVTSNVVQAQAGPSTTSPLKRHSAYSDVTLAHHASASGPSFAVSAPAVSASPTTPAVPSATPGIGSTSASSPGQRPLRRQPSLLDVTAPEDTAHSSGSQGSSSGTTLGYASGDMVIDSTPESLANQVSPGPGPIHPSATTTEGRGKGKKRARAEELDQDGLDMQETQRPIRRIKRVKSQGDVVARSTRSQTATPRVVVSAPSSRGKATRSTKGKGPMVN